MHDGKIFDYKTYFSYNKFYQKINPKFIHLEKLCTMLLKLISNAIFTGNIKMDTVTDDIGQTKEKETDEVEHFGGCHCGAIQFKVSAPKSPVIINCK